MFSTVKKKISSVFLNLKEESSYPSNLYLQKQPKNKRLMVMADLIQMFILHYQILKDVFSLTFSVLYLSSNRLSVHKLLFRP